MAPRRAHFVLSTHWDREWYQSFQDYRYRLVHILDSILDGLADGRLKGPFTTDGQAIILDDYLEVRPERRAQVEAFAREGKLVIGPWYVLPDEFLVSGEAMIRNIQLGRAIARRYGTEPSNAGFVCDLFGHVSQLPQMLNGFGIETAFVWRGLCLGNDHNLIWTGADGTEVVCHKFIRDGYCDYAFSMREAGTPTTGFDEKRFRENLEKTLAWEDEHTQVGSILLFDGGDHQPWDEKAYNILVERMNSGKKDYEIRHSTLDAYAKELVADRKKIKNRREGELRETADITRISAHQIHGVLSSRVWIKQQNAWCQTLLCQWAEPFAAFAAASIGTAWPQGFLDVAWKWLLQNHPHDSICGCSIDIVHEDMKYRFSQARQIGERVTLEANRALAASVEGSLADNEIRVVVFNPASVAHEGTAELDIELPKDGPKFAEFFGFEDLPVFRLFDVEGNEVPYQRVGQTLNNLRARFRKERFPEDFRVNVVRVSLELSVPAMGYTTLIVRPGEDRRQLRYPEVPGLATSPSSLENEYLAVWVGANGSLTMVDKRSGQSYDNLLQYLDEADIGDGWFHGRAANDQAYSSAASSAAVALIENGPRVAALRIRQTLHVPREFNSHTMRRTEELVALDIDTIVRLRADGDCIEVETTIDNVAKDHRVRVLFPSSADATTYLSDSAFDVIERPIALDPNNHTRFELEVETKPQQSWTAVFDKFRGLAVVSTGQLETAVRDLPEKPLALTLFRSTRRTVLTDGEPNGQIQGPLKFRYLLVPLVGAPDRVRMFQLGQKVATGGLRAVHIRPADIPIHAPGPKVPARAGFFALSGPAVLESARYVNGAIEARLFNPTGKAGKATLGWPEKPKSVKTWKTAELVDFDSRPVKGAKVELKKDGVTITLKPKQIVTVRLV